MPNNNNHNNNYNNNLWFNVNNNNKKAEYYSFLSLPLQSLKDKLAAHHKPFGMPYKNGNKNIHHT